MLKAELWDKHAGSFETLEAMLEIASPLILNKLKAKDAAIDARLASEREGLDTPTKPRYNCPTEAHDGEE